MTYVYDVDNDDLRNIDSSIEQKVPLNSQITTEVFILFYSIQTEF